MQVRKYSMCADRIQGKGQQAFTLVELMVTLVVMAILLAIAVPSFNDALLGTKLSGYANELVASTFLARSEAIKRNAVVTMCVSTDGTSCATSGGWEQGWIVACQSSDHVNCDGGSGWLVIKTEQAAHTGIKITESSTKMQLDFQPTGVGSTTATFTACRAIPSAGPQERVVTISATGRASVSKTTNGTCS